MFCGECGTENEESRNFCRNCGRPLRKARQAAAAGQAAPAPAAPEQQQAPAPSAHPPAAVPVPATAPPQQAAAAPAKPPLEKGLLGLGLFAIILGIVAWFRYPYLCGILAIVLGVGIIAKSENRRGAVAVTAALAIVIGLACIAVDMFYFTIFPVPKPVF